MPQTDGRCGSPARRAVGPGALRARQCGPCPAFSPSPHGCLQLLGPDGPVSVTAARVKPYSQSGSWPCRVSWDITVSGRQIQVCSASLKAAGILGRTMGSPTITSRQHTVTTFEDCNLAGEYRMNRLAARWKRLDRDLWEHKIEKKWINWSGRRESNPHDQLWKAGTASWPNAPVRRHDQDI
jgi:hypothetical protein